MSKRLALYGNEDYAGSFATVGNVIKSPRLAPYGDENYVGNVATVGTPKSATADANADRASGRRLVRLKAKAD